MQHRTDCITCKKPVYHPPIWGDDRDQSAYQFIGFRQNGGFMYKIKNGDHFIVLSRTGEHVIATCLRESELEEVISEMNALIALTPF